MGPESAIELGQEAVLVCLKIAAPILIVGVLVSVIIGLLQSLTQIQDQTISFVPKIILIGLTILLCLPWISETMVEFSHDLFSRPILMSPNYPEPESLPLSGMETTEQTT